MTTSLISRWLDCSILNHSITKSLVAAVLLLLGEQLPAQQAAQKGKWFTYEQVFEQGGQGLTAPLPDIAGWLDDHTYLEIRTDTEKQRRVYAVNASDGSSHIYRDYSEIQKDLPEGFSIQTADAATPELNRFIFNRENDLYFYDFQTRRFRRLTATAAAEQNPRFSPNGRWIAYTRDHNLFAYDLENFIEHQYSTDGSDSVYNGWASWVYYEEILGRASHYAAFWWSPDSTRLAFMRFDDSPVPKFAIYHAGGQHGELETQRYPKAGDPNPCVSIGVVTVADGRTAWMDFDRNADQYIAWPFWAPDSGTLTVQWMNRRQDTIRLYNCDAVTGKKTQAYEERQPSWVRFFEDLYCFKNGSGFLLRSDADGWDQLYIYNGRVKTRLTTGKWPVNSIVRVDETNGYVYFTGKPARTWDTQLLRVKLDGAGLEELSQGYGAHSVKLSPGGSFFIDTVSTITTPAVMSLYSVGGKLVRKLGEGHTAAMDDFAWGKAELFTIPSGDGYELPAYWVLPVNFDPNRQYPVIFTVYSGPETPTVSNTWLGLQPHYWAQRGVIIISVDHRGSGHFGKQGAALMYRNLGKWEMADLIAANRWLRNKPFVAKDRIGITGASYGGYATLLALTYASEYFNFGQAGSPVSDWRLYDTVYTERYMDTPAANPEGYKNGAILTWIERYRGGLRITHGTTDDNVHMQNTIQVVDWLTTHNKRFELMLYPESRHGIQPSQRAHLQRETHDFWMRNLIGKDPEQGH